MALQGLDAPAQQGFDASEPRGTGGLCFTVSGMPSRACLGPGASGLGGEQTGRHQRPELVGWQACEVDLETPFGAKQMGWGRCSGRAGWSGAGLGRGPP